MSRIFVPPTKSSNNCKYCRKPLDASNNHLCKGPCRKAMHYECVLQAYHNHMMTNVHDHDDICCVSCSIDRLNQNLFQIGGFGPTGNSNVNSPPKANISTCSDSPRKKSPDVKNKTGVFSLFRSSNVKSPPKDNVFTCFDSSTKKSPDVKNRVGAVSPFENSNVNSSSKDNISTRFDSPTKKSPDAKNRIGAGSPLENSNVNSSPKDNISTCFDSPTKESPDVKNRIGAVSPFENFNVNLPPKANISTCSDSPTKKFPDVKIGASDPSGNYNVNSPIANFSTCSDSSSKKSPGVNLQLQTDVTPPDANFQSIIKIQMETEQKLNHLQRSLQTQINTLPQTFVSFDSLTNLQKEIENERQINRIMQTSILNEVQSYKFQHEAIHNNFKEIKIQLEQILRMVLKTSGECRKV